MNTSESRSCARITTYSIGILGLFLIAGGLVWIMYSRTAPPAANADRVAERFKAYKEVNDGGAEALNNYGWVDPARGVVRLPIARAMELAIQQGKNPAGARSNLLSRVEKATAPLPKAPEKPSQFE